jgi:trehalose-6-phosphate hydrolase
MLNAHYASIGQYQDVESLNYYQILRNLGRTEKEALEILAARSRDNSRTPMQWDAGEYGGFSNTRPWIPVPDRLRSEMTVQEQQKETDSILAFYKKLTAMRKKYAVIAQGEISFLETGTDMVLAYKRVLGPQQLAVFSNLDRKQHKIKVPAEWSGCPVLLSNYEARERIPETEMHILQPYEFLVLGMGIK